MPSFAGFDTGSYPGDNVMTAWIGNPYQFAGFYLDAPCHTTHTFKPWAGKYRLLNGLGWGLVDQNVANSPDPSRTRMAFASDTIS